MLSRRTNEYRDWVEAFARSHHVPIEWAEPKARKEDYVRPAQRRMKRTRRHGVYFILKSMEQGQTFRSTVPRFPTADPHYRILALSRLRKFGQRDEWKGCSLAAIKMAEQRSNDDTPFTPDPFSGL